MHIQNFILTLAYNLKTTDMNQTIWKYEMPIKSNFILEMPRNSEILCLQIDGKTNRPCIWALVYPTLEKEERFFELLGTGHEVHNNMGVNRKYIGTYQCDKGEFVGHVFERIY